MYVLCPENSEADIINAFTGGVLNSDLILNGHGFKPRALHCLMKIYFTNVRKEKIKFSHYLRQILGM